MLLPSFKRLYKTDFEQQYQSLVDQLSYTINNGFESLYNLANKNISIKDNLLASIRDVNVTVDANGIPVGGASFAIDNSNTIVGLEVLKNTNTTSPTVFPTSGITINYTQSGTKIGIDHVTGLPANNAFVLRIIAYLS